MERRKNEENTFALRPSEENQPLDGKDDDALIRWMLSLHPNERLAVAQGFVDSVIDLDRARTD